MRGSVVCGLNFQEKQRSVGVVGREFFLSEAPRLCVKIKSKRDSVKQQKPAVVSAGAGGVAVRGGVGLMEDERGMGWFGLPILMQGVSGRRLVFHESTQNKLSEWKTAVKQEMFICAWLLVTFFSRESDSGLS